MLGGLDSALLGMDESAGVICWLSAGTVAGLLNTSSSGNGDAAVEVAIVKRKARLRRFMVIPMMNPQ